MEVAQPCTTMGENDGPPDFPGTTTPAWTLPDQTTENRRTKFKLRRTAIIVVLLQGSF
jgi:hypothetical protein